MTPTASIPIISPRKMRRRIRCLSRLRSQSPARERGTWRDAACCSGCFACRWQWALPRLVGGDFGRSPSHGQGLVRPVGRLNWDKAALHNAPWRNDRCGSIAALQRCHGRRALLPKTRHAERRELSKRANRSSTAGLTLEATNADVPRSESLNPGRHARRSRIETSHSPPRRPIPSSARPSARSL
jgi:hypothetical protein